MKILNSFVFQIAILSGLFYAIGDTLGLAHVVYILYGLWVSFSPTIGQSIQESSKRILGIIAGGFIGFISMVAWGQNTLSIGLGLGISILVCYGLGIPKSAVQAGASFCMVAIGYYEQGLNQYYWQRFIDNSIGVILGTVASFLVPPPRSAIQLQKGMGQVFRQMGTLYQTLVDEYFNPTSTGEKKVQQLSKNIQQTLAKNAKLFNFATLELSKGIGNQEEEKNLEEQQHLIEELLLSLKDMEKNSLNQPDNPIAQTLFPEISYLSKTTHQLFQQLINNSDAHLSADSPLTVPHLSDALANLENRLENLRHSSESKSYDLEQVIELSAFLDDLRTISNQLSRLSQILR